MANELSMEQLNQLFEYRDGSLYWKKSNSPRAKVGNKAGSLSKYGYVDVRVNGSLQKAHRIIFVMHHGYTPELIDHINGIRDDNRIENLRAADYQKNMFNSKAKQSFSGCKNIYWRESRKRWFVKLCIQDKQIYAGSFKELDKAKLAAQNARNQMHKEFARHE
jgi:hypothetical protein